MFKPLCLVVLSLAGAQLAAAAPGPTATPAPAPIPEGWVRYVCQPNGWGRTKEEAIKDLRVRILPWYQKTFGDRPGFTIDWEWASCVEVSAKRCWQADGRLWWYAPPVPERTPRGPKMGRFHYQGR